MKYKHPHHHPNASTHIDTCSFYTVPEPISIIIEWLDIGRGLFAFIFTYFNFLSSNSFYFNLYYAQSFAQSSNAIFCSQSLAVKIKPALIFLLEYVDSILI